MVKNMDMAHILIKMAQFTNKETGLMEFFNKIEK
jgi:hypothetical protein